MKYYKNKWNSPKQYKWCEKEKNSDLINEYDRKTIIQYEIV